jgi:hypothetical protein
VTTPVIDASIAVKWVVEEDGPAQLSTPAQKFTKVSFGFLGATVRSISPENGHGTVEKRG